MSVVNPYLNFSGNCEEAFDFYKSVFGGDYSSVNRFSEQPPEVPYPEGEGDKIMHIALPIGETLLMGSDVPSTMGTASAGTNTHVMVNPDSEGAAARIFNALAEGGHVTMPYEKQFWGDYFGSCIDRFGINWMVDYGVPEEN